MKKVSMLDTPMWNDKKSIPKLDINNAKKYEWYIEVFTEQDAIELGKNLNMSYVKLNHKQPNPANVGYRFVFKSEKEWRRAEKIKDKTKLIGLDDPEFNYGDRK